MPVNNEEIKPEENRQVDIRKHIYIIIGLSLLLIIGIIAAIVSK